MATEIGGGGGGAQPVANFGRARRLSFVASLSLSLSLSLHPCLTFTPKSQARWSTPPKPRPDLLPRGGAMGNGPHPYVDPNTLYREDAAPRSPPGLYFTCITETTRPEATSCHRL